MSTTLDDVSRLANAMVDAEEDVKSKSDMLDRAKERLRVLKEEAVPGIMQELGLTYLTLDTGKKLSIKQDVYASIAAGDKDKAFLWLDEHNFGGLIKVDIKVSYGKGERDNAIEFYNQCTGLGLSAALSEGIHAQTLKAFLNEQIRNGAEIPLELFGARPIWVAKITNK